MTTNAPTRLSQLRAASRAMLDGFTPAELQCQSHPELSPLLWHVGHVFFVETYWLAERVFGETGVTDAWRELYFPEMCAKDARGARLPGADSLRAWSDDLSQLNDRYWRQAAKHEHPLLAGGYLAAFVRQHYAQHLETMRLVAAQLRHARASERDDSGIQPRMPAGETRSVGAQPVTIGTATIDAYDNEQPVLTTSVADFDIAARPVSNAEWLGFMHNDGYKDQQFWDADGWAWRQAAGVCHPQHWQPMAGERWHVPADTADAPAQQPVHGISWFEARAFARYAGARLPREVEWEAACRADVLGESHQVWEWCDDAFHPYPGFRAFPYDGYSKSWFDGAHFVARGASYHTEPEIRRPGFRNFYPPTHRHVFAGLRLAW